MAAVSPTSASVINRSPRTIAVLPPSAFPASWRRSRVRAVERLALQSISGLARQTANRLYDVWERRLCTGGHEGGRKSMSSTPTTHAGSVLSLLGKVEG